MKSILLTLTASALLLPLGAAVPTPVPPPAEVETEELAPDWELLALVTDPDDGSLLGIWTNGTDLGVTDTHFEGGPGDEAPSLTTRWKSGGLEHEVKTPKASGDDTAAWVKKHRKHVDEALKAFPPDKTEPSDSGGDDKKPNYLTDFYVFSGGTRRCAAA